MIRSIRPNGIARYRSNHQRIKKQRGFNEAFRELSIFRKVQEDITDQILEDARLKKRWWER